MLINIDNGGTLTDICALKDDNFYKTKTLTTPYDLSKCFFDGLRAISEVIYGEEDVAKLLAEVGHIRYSTTQGTNAIVERKGPKLGLILNKGNRDLVRRIRAHDEELFDFLVGSRVVEIDLADLQEGGSSVNSATAITRLTSNGANRVVVCFDTVQARDSEALFKQIAFESYPRHLLGAVPVLFASELVDDVSMDRRAWTAIFNSFLHPAMEQFLYNAESRLREYRTKNPLLIFRNDGSASRVAKTIALKTYSSGPRGGMEGVKEFSRKYNLSNVLSMDIGGTTTDVGCVVRNTVNVGRRGNVEGVPISFGLCEIASMGSGGSSVLAVAEDIIQVGPESVGAVPGPACFGRGGKKATITDVNLLMGLFNSATFFGGGMVLDVERARKAIDDNVASVMGISIEEALFELRNAYEKKIGGGLADFTEIDDETVLMAFGGGGPMSACGVAERAGINTVFIPKMAAVFSACGIGSCDIGQSYSMVLPDSKSDTLAKVYEDLLDRADRDMFAEGFAKGEYETNACLVGIKDSRESAHQLGGKISMPHELADADTIILEMSARKVFATRDVGHATIEKTSPATSSETRSILGENRQWQDVSVYELNYLSPGTYGTGPAIIEEEYFTCLVREGWGFVISESGDIRLTKGEK